MAAVTNLSKHGLKGLKAQWDSHSSLPFSIDREISEVPDAQVKEIVLGIIKCTSEWNATIGQVNKARYSKVSPEELNGIQNLCAEFPMWTEVGINNNGTFEYLMSYYSGNIEAVAEQARNTIGLTAEVSQGIINVCTFFNAFKVKAQGLEGCTCPGDEGTLDHKFYVLRERLQQEGLMIGKLEDLPATGDPEVEEALGKMVKKCEMVFAALVKYLGVQDSSNVDALRKSLDAYYPAKNFAQKAPCEPARTNLGSTTGGMFAALEQAVKARLVGQQFILQHMEFFSTIYEITTYMDTRNYFNYQDGNKTPLLDEPPPIPYFSKMFGGRS